MESKGAEAAEPVSDAEGRSGLRSTAGGDSSDMEKFIRGKRIEAKDFSGRWYPAKVVDVDSGESEVLVHFEKWNHKFDEWIPMDSSRLRLPSKATKGDTGFVKGEQVMAMWSPYQKYPGTIQAVLSNDRYEVLFYDGFVKRLKSQKISKTEEGEVLNPAHSFTSGIGTKEERRERKRKINIPELFSVKKKKVGLRGRYKDMDMEGGKSTRSRTSRLRTAAATWRVESPVSDTQTTPIATRQRVTTPLLDPVPLKVKYYDGRTETWTKNVCKRSEGRTAGKLDIVILSPSGKKFRSRGDILKYCDENGIIYSPEAFDFSARGRAKSRYIPEATSVMAAEPEEPKKALEPAPVVIAAIVPEPFQAAIPTDEQKIVIGGLEVQKENGQLKCPGTNCSKLFRRENLLLMHLKHYHSEFCKYLEHTPSVTDLAYARTVGSLEPVVDGTPIMTTRKSEVVKQGSSKTDGAVAEKVQKKATSVVSAVAETGGAKEPKKLVIRSDIKTELKVTTGTPGHDPAPLSEQTEPDVSTMAHPLEHHQTTSVEDTRNRIKFMYEPEDVEAFIPSTKVRISTFKQSKAKRSLQGLHGSSESSRRRFKYRDMARRQIKTWSTPSSIAEEHISSNSNTSSQGSRPAQPSRVIQAAGEFSGEGTEGAEDSKSPVTVLSERPDRADDTQKVEKLRRHEIINCSCGVVEEDGLMIQCDVCLCWQHGHCSAILQDTDVPDKYICSICKHPPRGRKSMRHQHDQDWLKEGVLPRLSFHGRRDNPGRRLLLKRANDLSDSLTLLGQVIHSMRVKVNIAQHKDHPKLWLWNKWNEKHKPATWADLKEEKLDPTTTTPLPVEPMLPKIPEPEKPIDPVECRLNLLDHIHNYQNMVDARLSSIESQIAELESMQEDAMEDETAEQCPRTKATLMMLLRDLSTMKRIGNVS